MEKKQPRKKGFEFTIDESNLEFVIENVFEDNPAMIKELKDKLHQTPRIKSDKPPFCF